MKLGEKIKLLRHENNMTQDELASKLDITKQAVYKYENGIVTNIPSDKIERLAEIFNVSPVYLMGWDPQTHLCGPEKSCLIPVLGRVVAGVPISAYEDVLDYEEISLDMAASGEFYALRVKGQSMEPRICEGDTVIIKVQPDVESGDIAVVLVNGDEATLKQVFKNDAGITLVALNHSVYEPHFYTNKQIQERASGGRAV